MKAPAAATRSHSGARFAIGGIVAWAVLVWMLATPALGASPEDGPGPLPWRVAGRMGFTADAAAFPDSSGHSLEVYVRIPPSSFALLARDSTGEARLRLAARVTNRLRGRPHDAEQEFTVAPGDSGSGFGKVVMLRFPVRPGVHRLSLKLEDLLSRKRGIAYTGRKVTESAAVQGDLTVPSAQSALELSDLEFVWGEAGGEAARGFQRGGAALLPNPERLYGLLASELRASFMARASEGSRPWHWRARVLDQDEQVVAERESTQTAGPRLDQSLAIDLSTQPAGGYDLELSVWRDGDSSPLVRRAHFSVAWLRGTWEGRPSDVEDLVHFLLQAEDEDRFARLHPGEQERYLEEFWRQRDPTPGTAENESRAVFLSRVEHANRMYSRAGLGKGMFSDMGRAYIRYGEPDEVLKQVIPAGDQTLMQVLQQLDLTEDRPTGDVHSKGLGGDTRAFEIWIYEGEREPPPDADRSARANPRPRKRLLFLFVDEHGYGDYTLRYTTE